DKHELAPGKLVAGGAEQYRRLDRKDVLAVEVLVQAVVVAFPVFQDQRRRAALPGIVTALEPSVESLGKAWLQPQPLVPVVGYRRQLRVERLAQCSDRLRQRIAQVFVLSAAEIVPRHD